MSYGVMQPAPSECGQTAIAVLVGDGFMEFVAFGVGLEDTIGSELVLPNGAQADRSSMNTRNGSNRRGICIDVSYLSIISAYINLMSKFENPS
jgi:hypothetical protein